MPTYTYWCDDCGERTSLLVPMAQRDDAYRCDCGGSLTRGIDRPGWVWAPTSGKG